MLVLAIDPGYRESAWLVYDTETKRPLRFAKEPNEVVRAMVAERDELLRVKADHLAVEMLQSYGMPAGREMFHTALWVGRFMEAWAGGNADKVTLIYRPAIKAHICNDARAKDANVREAIMDRYGGKEFALGTKRAPGPLHGMKADVWAAFALAIAWAETSDAAVAA